MTGYKRQMKHEVSRRPPRSNVAKVGCVVAFSATLIAFAAACGNTGTHHKVAGKSTSSTVSVPSMATLPNSTSPTSAPADEPATTLSPTTTSGAPSACSASELSVTLVQKTGGGGIGYYIFRAQYRGVGACEIGGFFGVSVYGTSGALLNGSAERSSSMPGAYGGPPERVQLSMNGSTYFKVEVGENPGNANSCPGIGSFHLIPPNSKQAILVSIPTSSNYQYCGLPFSVGPTHA